MIFLSFTLIIPFIINLKDDEVEFIEEAEDLDRRTKFRNGGLIVQANAFYDREMERYEKNSFFLK
jgi:hypothetical protein